VPEGHTLHRLAQALDAAFRGTRPSASSPQGRFEAGAARLDGREVLEASAWGKHLFMEFAGDTWLNVHLGLIGKFSVDQLAVDGGGYAAVPAPRGAVRLRLVNDRYLADLRGAILCQVVTPAEVEAIVARLGPDPLRADQDPSLPWARVSRSGRTIAELLMDQSILAGVGNVYRCEVLYRHRVDPLRPGKEIRRSTWDAIWADLVRLLPLGVAFNQIITMPDQVERAEAMVAAGQVPALTSTWTDSARRTAPGPAGVVAVEDLEALAEVDAAQAPAALGDAEDAEEAEEAEGSETTVAGMQRRYYVYRRQGQACRVCGSKVRTKVVAGRNLFWCGRCQRRR
jgi:endonuclease VIII